MSNVSYILVFQMWNIIFLFFICGMSQTLFLFQRVEDARNLLKYFDENLGKSLPEKNYGGNCLIYDPQHDDPFHNLKVSKTIFIRI